MTEPTDASLSDQPLPKAPQHHPRGLWLVGLLLGLLATTFAQAQTPLPPKATSKPAEQTLYVYRDGTMIGLILRYKKPYPVELMINAAHKLHWLRLQIGGVRLLILGQGGVLIDQIRPRPNDRIVFQGQGRLDAIGKIKCTYDLNGRISQIGTMSFGYDLHGRLARLGKHVIKYRNDRKVESVGGYKLAYRSEGRLEKLGPVGLTYRADGKLATIGKITLKYHPLRNVVYRSQGREERIQIQIQWTTLGIYRILRKK